MSSKVSYFSFENARVNCRESRITEVLTGLGKGEFGFLIGPPGLGKTNISLSIAYEVTTGDNFLGLKVRNFNVAELALSQLSL